MRRAAVVSVGALAVVAVSVALRPGGAGEAVRDIAVAPGLEEGPRFAIRLGGPLWRDRAVVDEDGARDVALVSADERLDIEVVTGGAGSPATVEVQVDGRRARWLRVRCTTPCQTLRWAPMVPLGSLTDGEHRVAVVARDSAARPGGSAEVLVRTVRSLPRIVEGDPAQRGAPAARTPAITPAAARVLRRLRRTTLRPLLGGSRPRIQEVGTVTGGGRRVGLALLLRVEPARRDVLARLPVYTRGAGGSTRTQIVEARVALLRDLLVEIDVRRGRLLAAEPGPDSVTTSWQAPAAPGTEDED